MAVVIGLLQAQGAIQADAVLAETAGGIRQQPAQLGAFLRSMPAAGQQPS